MQTAVGSRAPLMPHRGKPIAERRRWPLTTLVSGGQTGADRAALDVALALGYAVAGWVPAGRRAEDGVIPLQYQGLRETPGQDPAERTRRNVRDSDATLVLARGEPGGGTALAIATARRLGAPLLIVDLCVVDEHAAAKRVRRWLHVNDVARLNVAGPRASEDPEIYAATRAVLERALGPGPGSGQG